MGTFYSRQKSAAETERSAAQVGQLYLDTGRRILQCLNETARRFVREGIPLTGADLARQPLRALSGRPVGESDLPITRARREQVPIEDTFVLTRPNAVPLHLRWSAAPVFDSDGELQGVAASLIVAPPEPDWQELGGLCHDLRTPLQAVRLLAPVLDSLPTLDPRAIEVLDNVRAAANRALAIGLELLEWCRAPLQGRPRSRAWVRLFPFLSSLAAEQQPEARRKGIGLHLDVEAVLDLEASTDEMRLGRLLANLLSNAVRYTSTGLVRLLASWRVDAQGQRQVLALSIIDTGGGISPEEQDSIFQPFERGKKHEGESSGSGLGLAVVDRLVGELGLKLEVFSEFGHGSTFELLVPAGLLRSTDGVAAVPGNGRRSGG
jgi:two-component sensor histidine kinase